MSITVAEIQARVMEQIRSYPYSSVSGSGLEGRITNAVTDMFAHINGIFEWWYARQGKTSATGVLEEALRSIGYHGSLMAVLADLGDSERSDAHQAIFNTLVKQLHESFSLNKG